MLLFACGCSKAPTQIVVAVGSDLAVPAEMTSIRALIKSETEVPISERAFPLNEVTVPFSFGVAPGGGEREPKVIIELQAVAADGSTRVVRRAVTGFIEHKTLLLPMFLARSCIASTCSTGDTCTESGCAAEAIDPSQLTEIEPGTELEMISRDAGPDDAGDEPHDASEEDATVRPDASEDGGVVGVCDPPARDGDSCGAGALRCCRGSCVDTGSDENACGADCTACGANAECDQGQCECMAPFDNCDDEPGCEADLSSDRLNCDVCEMSCGAGLSCIERECVACSTSLECPVDRLPCTDAPVCTGGVCSQPLFSGFCLIGGACYDEGDINPTDPCLRCTTALDPVGWSPFVANACNDGLFCTPTDACDALGHCIGSGVACPDDGLACTVETCSEQLARCDPMIATSSCLIAGQCRNEGDLNPANACEVCNPNATQTEFFPNSGASCNDNLFCNGTDTCSAQGTCVSSGDPCAMSTICTDETCDEQLDMCVEVVNPSFCLIANSCVAEGTSDPNNPCQTCQSLVAQRGYSPLPDQQTCGFNALCCNGTCTLSDEGACGICGVNCSPLQCVCDGTGNGNSCTCQP